MLLTMDISSFNPQTILRKLREYSRKLWVRVVAMGLMSIVALGLTQLLGGFFPSELDKILTENATSYLLDIIANAMLAVTIFSITIMVSVYQSSSTQWTPRVHRLILHDPTTQNTMAVFIGAYVYALIAIVLMETGAFSGKRSFPLFLMTVLVLVLIVYSLIRWLLHLQTFGSLINTTRQIEEVTVHQFEERLKNPCLGANSLTSDVPDDAEPIRAEQSGYIQNLYPEALDEIAHDCGVELYLIKNIGHFIFVNETLAMAVRRAEPKDQDHDWERLQKGVRANISIGDLRTFDQDPRFGLVVMGEIGSKALSPGINDPGTAIDVITRIGRILSKYKDETQNEAETKLAHLYVPPIDPADLIEDGFGALARDGAPVVEVQQRLQAVLSGLMRHPDDGLNRAARAAAENHLRRALQSTDFAPDRARLLASARSDIREAVQKNVNDSTG